MIQMLRRIPRHVGIIPDGNRRWADRQGRKRSEGYEAGINPALQLIELCRQLGIAEVTFYGFTKENVRRPKEQVRAFQAACVDSCYRVAERGAALLAVGDTRSKVFPDALKPFAADRTSGDIRANILVNYGWQWDIRQAWLQPEQNGRKRSQSACLKMIGSREVSAIDLVVRWGGRQRLSGFLPVQCAYADFFRVNTLWPDMAREDLLGALQWYQDQDITRGG